MTTPEDGRYDYAEGQYAVRTGLADAVAGPDLFGPTILGMDVTESTFGSFDLLVQAQNTQRVQSAPRGWVGSMAGASRGLREAPGGA